MFVALDLSWATCGICQGLDARTETLLFKPPMSLIERAKIIDDHIISPVISCHLEGYSFGSRGRAITDMAELRGVLKYLLDIRKIPIIVVAPMQIKKFITGSGNAGKDKVQIAIYKRWGREFPDSHQSDAFALWQLAGATIRCQNNLAELNGYPKFQQEILSLQIKSHPSRSP